MIDVRCLSFDYPGLRALDDVSFHLPVGSITALVGPNGAGKTTLLRCLAALEPPACGEITINGVDALAEPRECHRQLGYLSDFFGLYDALTCRQCLLHAAAINGVATARQDEVAQRAAQRLGIEGKLEERASALSRGQRQRLAIAQAIVHNPKVLLLDEPASGLDPEARHSLAELFLHLKSEGMTLLVSSHILAELEEYSTDMLVLRNGKIISHQPINSRQQSSASIRFMLALTRHVPGLVELLAGIEGLDTVSETANGALFNMPDDADEQHRLLRNLLDQGLPVCGFAPERRSMQDAYLATVGDHREVQP